MLDPWRLGNIEIDSIDAMLHGDKAQDFIRFSAQKSPECQQCRWQALCRGGCRRERELPGGTGLGQNIFCSSYRGFFDYAYERLVRVAHMVRSV
jgi:uncharacterized protein